MTLAIAATNSYSLTPRIKLVATSTTSAPNAVPNNTLIEVWRTHEDGTVHRVLTEVGPRLIGGGWAWFDVHCPFNQAVTYTVTAGAATATSTPVWLPSDRAWLIHSSDPDQSVMVEAVREIGDRKTESRSGRFEPIGAKAIFLTDGFRGGIKGSITLRVTRETALRNLFADDSVILLNTPGRAAGWDLDYLWIQPDDISYSNPADGWIHYPYRYVEIGFEEAADPDVELTPIWTSGDAAAYWLSQGVNSAGMVTKYATSLDLVTDTRL